MSARPREARARAWLDRAIDEMELAKDLADNWRGNLEHAGVHAQQAAEKAIKAGLILQDGTHPRDHDLDELRDQLSPDWRLHVTHAASLHRSVRNSVSGPFPAGPDRTGSRSPM